MNTVTSMSVLAAAMPITAAAAMGQSPRSTERRDARKARGAEYDRKRFAKEREIVDRLNSKQTQTA